MDIRPIQSDADFPSVVAVLNAFETIPVTLTQFKGWLENAIPDRICRRRVAVDPQDHVIGYSVIVRESYMPEGQFSVWVGVHPASRGAGAGAMLYEDAASFLREQGATSLRSEVRDDGLESLQFAEHRGFHVHHHTFESVLDLTTFDERAYRSLLTAVEASAIRLCSVADFSDTPEARRKLYELNRVTGLDEPDSDGTSMPFEDFEKWICNAEWYRPDGQLIAVDGGAWVGLAAVRLVPETQEAYNLMTGVLRSYRGRKIAQALKLRAIRYARQHGCRALRTNNDSQNIPMLAINQKLGYQPRPGKYILCGSLI